MKSENLIKISIIKIKGRDIRIKTTARTGKKWFYVYF